MADLLVEISSEEMPARMQMPALKTMQMALKDLFDGAGLGFDKMEFYISPRRIALSVKGLPLQQKDQRIEKKGPSVNANEKAIEGFMRSNGYNDINQLEIRDSAKGQQYWAVKEVKGQECTQILPTLLNQWIVGHKWPKSMRMADMQFRWVRPLLGIMALFDEKKLDGILWLDETHAIEFCDYTHGHALIDPQKIIPKDFDDYKAKLKQHFVMIDHEERLNEIITQASKLCESVGCELKMDKGLLDELTGLVEWPHAMLGKIDKQFMELPSDVLYASMKGHQKYLAMIKQSNDNKNNQLAPYFIVIANRQPKDGGVEIINGNERVLRARLDDARFFFEQDQKRSLIDYAPELERRVFHAKLGHLGEKTDRLAFISSLILQDMLGIDDKDTRLLADVKQASQLSKCDLATQMVGEFPELQGKMGNIYAKIDGMSQEICDAIEDHYAPLGPQSNTPKAPLSIALALADKIDNLMGFFLIDERPTGSKDPYALRRSALGIIRIIIENELHLDAKMMLKTGYAAYKNHSPLDKNHMTETVIDEVNAFIHDRLLSYYKDQGFEHNEIMAVISEDHQTNNHLLICERKLKALHDFMKTEKAKSLMSLYKRAYNILKSEKILLDGASEFDNSQFKRNEEKTLSITMENVNSVYAHEDKLKIKTTEFYRKQLDNYLNYQQPMADFFENVTVLDSDDTLRHNRLHLLKSIYLTFNNLIDFSKLI